MRIAWIADYKLEQHRGGSQQTNFRMIEYGKKLGHEIVEMDAETLTVDSSFDIAITNNITTFNITDIIDIADTIPSVRFEHDYWCSQKHPELFERSKLNIFLSPMHLLRSIGHAKQYIGAVCIPSPIDSSVFHNTGAIKEKDTVVWVGSTAPHKGLNNLIQYAKDNPEKKISIVSFDFADIELPENISFVGEKHDEELAKVYRNTETFFHHPQFEPFGRTVMEAYLCGCDLDLNEHIGAMSYDWNYDDYDFVKEQLQSESKFWNVIENEL